MFGNIVAVRVYKALANDEVCLNLVQLCKTANRLTGRLVLSQLVATVCGLGNSDNLANVLL